MVGGGQPQGGGAQKPGPQGLNEKVQQRYQQSQVLCACLSRPRAHRTRAGVPLLLRAAPRSAGGRACWCAERYCPAGCGLRAAGCAGGAWYRVPEFCRTPELVPAQQRWS